MEFYFGHQQTTTEQLKCWVLWAAVMSPVFALIPQKIFSFRTRAYAITTAIFMVISIPAAAWYATSFFNGLETAQRNAIELTFQAPRERITSIGMQDIASIKISTHGSRPGPGSCTLVIETVNQTYESHRDECQKVEAARMALSLEKH